MRAYKIHCLEATGFAGSMGEARKVRQDMVEQTGVGKTKIEIEEIDIDTKKVGLISFLNNLTGMYNKPNGATGAQTAEEAQGGSDA